MILICVIKESIKNMALSPDGRKFDGAVFLYSGDAFELIALINTLWCIK